MMMMWRNSNNRGCGRPSKQLCQSRLIGEIQKKGIASSRGQESLVGNHRSRRRKGSGSLLLLLLLLLPLLQGGYL